MKPRAFNVQIFLELCCCACFAVTLLWLVYGGTYLSYVTPRMKPYLIFAALLMAVWCVADCFRLFRPQHRKRVSHCFVLLIPLFLFFLPHSPVTESSFLGGFVSGGAMASAGTANVGGPGFSLSPPADRTGSSAASPLPQAPANPKGDIQEDGPDSPNEAAAVKENANGDNTFASMDAWGNPLTLHGYDQQQKKITVSHEEFYSWLSAISQDLDQFDGWKISMMGFVYREPETMADDAFALARLMMSCCVADLVPCGFLCSYDGTSELKAEEWIQVEGTLYAKVYPSGMKEPRIQVNSILPAQRTEAYVYPF